MTYQDYVNHLKVCEILDKEPAGHFRKIHDFLTGSWNGMEIVVDSRTNRIVIQKEGEWFFEQDKNNGWLWCGYEQVWSFFLNDMGMEELTEIQGFIKSAVDEHLKCEVGTPSLDSDTFVRWWKNAHKEIGVVTS